MRAALPSVWYLSLAVWQPPNLTALLTRTLAWVSLILGAAMLLALVLRMVVLLVLVALAFLWPALVAQVGMPMAVLAVLVLAAAAPLMLTTLAYAFAATAGPGVRIGLRGLAGEALALAFAFLVTQPFERWVMGSDAVGRLPPDAPFTGVPE